MRKHVKIFESARWISGNVIYLLRKTLTTSNVFCDQRSYAINCEYFYWIWHLIKILDRAIFLILISVLNLSRAFVGGHLRLIYGGTAVSNTLLFLLLEMNSYIFCAYNLLFYTINNFLAIRLQPNFSLEWRFGGGLSYFNILPNILGIVVLFAPRFWCLKWFLWKALSRCSAWECPGLIPLLSDCWLKPLICALRNHSVDIFTSNGLRDALGPKDR